MPRCRRSCLTFWTSRPRRGGYQPPAGAYYAPLQTAGVGLAAHSKPAPPPCPAGRPRLIFFPFRGGAGTGPAFPTAPHPVGAAISRPTGACYAPLQISGGLAAAQHTDTAPLSGGAAPSYFSPFVGNAGTGPAFPADPHPVGAAVSRPRAHAMRPYKRGAGAGGGTAHRYRPFPFRKIRRTTIPNAVRRLIRLPSALHSAGHFQKPSVQEGF